MRKTITIAIDGFSSCGKSTLAKALAKELSYIFIDTGAMYRGVALYCMRKGFLSHDVLNTPQIIASLKNIELHFELNEDTGKPELYLNGVNEESNIRKLDVSQCVSPVATIKEVRKKLVSAQRKMGDNGGVVMDGRDIGTVVFPKAELKIFITADKLIRTERRWKELHAKGDQATRDEIMVNLLERDHIDSTREESPLRQAEDAIVLDNSDLDQLEQLEIALGWVNDRL
jgi:cytidylate kinase